MPTKVDIFMERKEMEKVCFHFKHKSIGDTLDEYYETVRKLLGIQDYNVYGNYFIYEDGLWTRKHKKPEGFNILTTPSTLEEFKKLVKEVESMKKGEKMFKKGTIWLVIEDLDEDGIHYSKNSIFVQQEDSVNPNTLVRIWFMDWNRYLKEIDDPEEFFKTVKKIKGKHGLYTVNGYNTDRKGIDTENGFIDINNVEYVVFKEDQKKEEDKSTMVKKGDIYKCVTVENHNFKRDEYYLATQDSDHSVVAVIDESRKTSISKSKNFVKIQYAIDTMFLPNSLYMSVSWKGHNFINGLTYLTNKDGKLLNPGRSSTKSPKHFVRIIDEEQSPTADGWDTEERPAGEERDMNEISFNHLRSLKNEPLLTKFGSSIFIYTKNQMKNRGITFNEEGFPKNTHGWNPEMEDIYGKEFKIHAIKNDYLFIFHKEERFSISKELFYKTKNNLPIPEEVPNFDVEWEEDVPSKETRKEKRIELIDVKVKDEIKLMMPTPILLEGPVGTGKSTILIEIAEELGLKYYATTLTDQTSKSEFTGYRNVTNGEYVRPEFREAFEHGGMYVIEELNAGTSNMPIIFNSIENGYFTFADKMIKAHPDFRLCATMNTITNAKDFGGRRTVDKSVFDRFHRIMVMGDKIRFDGPTIEYRNAINKQFKERGISYEVTNRDCKRFEQMVKNGMQIETAISKCMVKDYFKLDPNSLQKIKRRGSEWEL